MFKATKLGLLNFWFYDEEEFSFYDGKLLLRGQNGSGKSVTMQSFIPLILDGNKSPKRLDTFGSVDKHIEYYLLGDNKDTSTGYLYMEFYSEEKDKYITIGLGFLARKGKTTEQYGFALKDGKRINEDFFLYKNKDGINKTPLTKLELKAALGPNNCFVETAKDYKKLVNNLLFQFPNIESYDEFINVLLQIRSPKLSKDYKPSKLMGILNDVLPPLADEDLRPLSDTIENLNQTKEKMEDLKQKIKILSNFIKTYHRYNEAVFYSKSKSYVSKYMELEELKTTQAEIKKTINNLEEELVKLNDSQVTLTDNYQKARLEKENIDDHDLEQKAKQKTILENKLDELQKSIEKEENTLNDINQKIGEITAKIKHQEGENLDILNKQKEQLTDCLDLASELNFHEFLELLPMILDNNESFAHLKKITTDFRREIDFMKNLLEEKENFLTLQDTQQQEYENYQKLYIEEEKNQEKCEENLSLELENLISNIHHLASKNQCLQLLEEDLKEIFHYLEDGYSIYNYVKAERRYKEYAEQQLQSLNTELANLKVKEQLETNQIEKLQEQLENLRNEKENLFPINSLENETIAFLEEENILYLPFYQAVEYQDNVNEELSNKLEEMLISSGILGAKIINFEDEKKLQSKNISYLAKTTKKPNNLTKYLRPAINDVFDAKMINDILESISISEKDEINFGENGFQFDFLKGNVGGNYESQYIGILNRRRHQEEKIKNLEQEIKVLNGTRNILLKAIDKIYEKMTLLNQEKNNFPPNQKLEEIQRQISEHDREMNFLYQKELACEEKIREYQEKVEKILKMLEQHKSSIPLNLIAYKEASVNGLELQNNLQTLENIHNSYNDKIALLNSFQMNLNDNEETANQMYAIIYDHKKEEKNCNLELDVINKLFETEEYQELGKKLSELTNIIESYPKQTSHISSEIGQVQAELKQMIQKDENIFDDIKSFEVLVEVANLILKEELDLKYVKTEENVNIELAKRWLKELENTQVDVSTALGNYYHAYNEYRQELLDYGINDIVLFKERDSLLAMYQNEHQDVTKINELYKQATRQDIITSYQGKKMSLYSLLDSLKDAYEADKIYLDEQDRRLFEDILLKTVGSKIKQKIMDAEEWVLNINNIMSLKQENSNLAFHLNWKPKSKESLEEMDTKELVDLFRLPDGSNSSLNVQRLTTHFRSKISRAEEFMQDSQDSYFQLVSNILDYRSWFEFKLYFKKDGQERKELTDKIFSVFSGGEKAKTMYVPLFASVYAKLDNASPLAPRLIALDEAFAGVDDKNIAEMFAILNSFKLDYLLTSQALWCDYKEVQDISICELIRPANQTTIGVRRYRWNGQEREYISSKVA